MLRLGQTDGMVTKNAVGEFLVDCQSRGLRPKTLEQYRWALAYLSECCVELPTHRRELRAVLDRPKLSQESRRDLRRCLNRFLRWCVA